MRALAASAGAVLAAAVLWASAGGSEAQPPGPHVSPGHPVKVTGCPAEDSCRIDYRSSGKWVISYDQRH